MALNRTLAWLLVALLVPTACARPSASINSPTPRAPGPAVGAVRAVVGFWVDGDSVHVRLEGRPAGTRTFPVRLIGIDAPETSPGEHAQRHVRRFNRTLDEIMALGRRSRAAAQQLAPSGTVVVLERDVEERDQNRRTLAYVWLSDGRMMNQELVRAGWAVTLTIPPNVKHVERFTSAQREARRTRVGIWAP